MSTQNEQSLRIFTVLSQIEQVLESAPRQKFSSGNRRIVDVDELYDLLGDLKVTIPEDIRRANSVLIEADTLLDHANQEAVDIVEQAQREAAKIRLLAEEEFEARVAEDKVSQEVQRRAELLQQHAERNATIVYNGAKQYADEILMDVQRYLMEYHHMVAQNRAELGVAQVEAVPVPQAPEAPIAPIAPQQPAVPQKPERRPVEPHVPAPVQEEEEEEKPEPKRKRGGWFFRRDDDDLFDEEDVPEEEEPVEDTSKKGRRAKQHRREEDLDLDLDE